MTSAAPETDSDVTVDVAGAVLCGLREAQESVFAAEARKLALAVEWAALHPASSIDDAVAWVVPGGERARRLAGPGTPTVAEFCLADLAAALGVTNDAARSLMADGLELAHRLPRLFARVRAGEVPAWNARRVAARTTTLQPAAADWVDRHAAHAAHRLSGPGVERLVESAVAMVDPEAAQVAADLAADGRHFDVDLRALPLTGTVQVSGCVDLADGLDLETALQYSAQVQADLGSTLSLDQRRAHAIGEIARAQLTIALEVSATDGADRGPTPAPRKVVIHVHLSRAALGGANDPVRVRSRGTGEVLTLAEQARTWAQGAGTVTVVPVVDIDDATLDALTATGYAVPAYLDRLVRLRDRHCVFPYCRRPAESCDLDHVIPFAEGGLTTAANLAPLCRFHHRLKTHGRWRYRTHDTDTPGVYRWTSPHGDRFTVDVRPGSGPRSGTTRHPDPG